MPEGQCQKATYARRPVPKTKCAKRPPPDPPPQYPPTPKRTWDRTWKELVTRDTYPLKGHGTKDLEGTWSQRYPPTPRQ